MLSVRWTLVICVIALAAGRPGIVLADPHLDEFVSAAAGGDVATVQDLLGKGVNVNGESRGTTALLEASKEGNLKTVRALIAAGADIDPARPSMSDRGPFETALSLAAGNGYLKVVQALLAAGAHVNAKNVTPQRVATYMDGPRRMYPPVGCTALITASSSGNALIVKELLAAHADVNERCFNGETALILASRKGDLDTVKALLAAGADVNASGGMDAADTAVIAAARHCHTEVLQTLLVAGGNMKPAPGFYGTALAQASWQGCLDAVHVLLAAGADVNDYQTPGYVQVPPLYEAAEQGHLEVLQALLAAKADVNEQGNYGTALYAAAGAGHLEVVRALLAAGADIKAKAPDGSTALTSAYRNHHKDIVDILNVDHLPLQ